MQILSLDIADANTAIKLCKIKTPTHSFSILDVVLRQDKRREATSSIYIFFTITGSENYRVSIN